MKKLLVVVLVLFVCVAALGYWRGWFSVTKAGTVDVQGDSAKFKEDKESFSKTVGENTKALKAKIAGLGKNTEELTDDDKKELAELEKKHERLETQLKELEESGPEKFESLKQDLSKNLKEVEQQIEELTQKVAKKKDK
jgi:hypothetical protein